MRWRYGLRGKTRTANESVKLVISPRMGVIDCAPASPAKAQTADMAAVTNRTSRPALIPLTSYSQVIVTSAEYSPAGKAPSLLVASRSTDRLVRPASSAVGTDPSTSVAVVAPDAL